MMKVFLDKVREFRGQFNEAWDEVNDRLPGGGRRFGSPEQPDAFARLFAAVFVPVGAVVTALVIWFVVMGPS